MIVELKIPSGGESITEVQIGAWLKPEGAYVERDEAVVELETDKASMELPSPVSGILKKHVKAAGEIVPVGSVIALIEEAERPAAVLPAHAPRPPKPAGARAAEAAPREGEASAEPPRRAHMPAPPGGPPRTADTAAPAAESRIMPAARRALADAGLQPSDVRPTGPGGRLLKEDVQRHVAGDGATREGEAPAEPQRPAAPTAGADGYRQEEAVPMTMLRRRIAQRLVEANQTMAMLTTFNEVDLSTVQRLRAERGEAFRKRYNVKLGIMSFFVKAAIDALKQWPAANAEIRGDSIVYKNYYDIGVAVSTEHGLVVPVIRDAERLSFAEVELAIADLAARARDRKITIEELQGGTFTITNGGVFGSLLATPIINPPQSAILGLHVIQDRPVARDGQVVIRPMMYVALTYDHRIIDGRESVSFLKRIKECVEDPPRMLVEV
jgi:2-oxoglutarate dehydrogenase E2 component (dihydrolipoamide succinyltransferase)